MAVTRRAKPGGAPFVRSKYVSALFPERGLSLATLSAVSRTPGMGGFLIYPLIYPNP
jgi:hypothetical protein